MRDSGHRFTSSDRQRRHRRSELHSPAAPLLLIGPLKTLSLGVALLLSALVLAAKRRTELWTSLQKHQKSTASQPVATISEVMRNEQRSEIRPEPPIDQVVSESTQHLTSSLLRLYRTGISCLAFPGATPNLQVPNCFSRQDWPQTSLQSWSHLPISFARSLSASVPETPVVSSRRMPCPAHSG